MTKPLTLIYRKVSELKPDPKNANSHPQSQVDELRASIRESGYIAPLLLNPEDIVKAGNGRLLAVIAEGIEEVPTITMHGLSDLQWRKLVIADNRIARNSVWNEDLLRAELGDLAMSGSIVKAERLAAKAKP